jgi:hypothetical protein
MSTEALIAADFRLPCFNHQLREFEEYCDAPARALAWSMRTGKSKAVVDKSSHLYRRGKIDGVLIFAPNGVHSNWAEVEFPKHAWPGIRCSPLVWRSADTSVKAAKKLRIAERDEWALKRAQWYSTLKKANTSSELFIMAVNSESMTRADVRKAVAYFMKRRRVLCVWDESDDFGTPGAQRTKMARAVALRAPYRTILSGTIATSSPLILFSQFELLAKNALGFGTFQEFKDYFAEYETGYGPGGSKFPKLKGFRNLEELRERMAKFTSVVLREECDDMPELQFRERKIASTPQQLEAYRDLHESFLLEIGDETVSVGEKASRLQKMQQIFSGFVFDEFKTLHSIPGDNPRLDALAEEVYRAPGKVVIWCAFQPDMDAVRSRLELDGIECVEYHGRVPDKAKADALRTFREKRAAKALIGHPKSGGRGLDFSVASTILNYSHTFSARDRVQSLERATKVGGRNIEVIDFVAPGPDQYILKTTGKRIEIADALAGTGLRDLLEGLRL